MIFQEGPVVRSRANIMAGIFYPDDPDVARASLVSFGLKPSSGGSARFLIAPHACWDLSGKTAARGFAEVSGAPIQDVVILGPVHDRAEEGLILSESSVFRTVLGDLEVNQPLCQELESCGTSFAFNDIPHLEEHSIEIVLPFVKFCFPEARIVPILVGGTRASTVRALSRALDLVCAPIADSTLFLVSTNLSSYADASITKKQAEDFLGHILGRNSDGILTGIADGTVPACGAAACAALLSSHLLDGLSGRIVDRADSDTTIPGETQDEGKRVHYASVVFG